MKKKFQTAILAAAACTLLAGCGGGGKKVDTAALADSLVHDVTYTGELNQIGEDEISNFIKLEDGVEGVLYMSSVGTAEEVAVFTASDEQTAKVMETNVEAFLRDQKSAVEDYKPEEAKRIDEAVLEQEGKYVVLCVSGDSEKAEDIIERALND